jgi:hypothetical protein
MKTIRDYINLLDTLSEAELRTPDQIATSANYLTANDPGRNPNAGLEPGDPRWRGAPPTAAPRSVNVDVRKVQQDAKVKAYQDAIAAGKTEAEAQNAEAAAGNLAGAAALADPAVTAAISSAPQAAAPTPDKSNPYTTPEDRAKFAAMSPEDKEWYTRGGQVPDINDQYIAYRAPNKGRAVAQAPAAAPAPVAQAIPVAEPAPAAPVTAAPAPTAGQAGMAAAAPAPAAPKPMDPVVVHIQQTLKRLGAQLGATGPNKDGIDGNKGPKTIAMMKKYGIGDDGKPIPNPAAPATGTQSNAVVNAAAAGANPTDVETGGGAFLGNPNVQGAQARMSPALAAKPIDPATGKPTDWPKMSLAQRAQWNNLQRANAPKTPPAPRTAPAPAPVQETSDAGYNELQRLVSLVHHR